MKELLCRYAAYNQWANQKMLQRIEAMDENLCFQLTPSSFNSIYKTIMHIWDAESVWWQRMRMHDKLVIPSAAFQPHLRDACNGLMQQSSLWEPFIRDSLNEDAIRSKLIYRNSKGEEFWQPVHEVLQHVFNHSTYHRGQLVTMMHALGESDIPQTDFIMFTRIHPE